MERSASTASCQLWLPKRKPMFWSSTGHTFAVFSGSESSIGAGELLVFTAQNLQPRVHVSPISITVAVVVSPPQHSPIFGHCASSQTVARFNPDSCRLMPCARSPGACCRSHGGFCRSCKCPAARFASEGSASTPSLTSSAYASVVAWCGPCCPSCR